VKKREKDGKAEGMERTVIAFLSSISSHSSLKFLTPRMRTDASSPGATVFSACISQSEQLVGARRMTFSGLLFAAVQPRKKQTTERIGKGIWGWKSCGDNSRPASSLRPRVAGRDGRCFIVAPQQVGLRRLLALVLGAWGRLAAMPLL